MHPNGGASSLTVPPGFRFHPTDEELLYYYLRKKVAYEAIDLDVIREIDLNKLEPWDLKDRCRIGTGPQEEEWYFFSHKDKKYPTGTRTNRATAAGFWKATGRDKVVFLGNGGGGRKIGQRKTLVFYTGRAPHGKKTDWIMHEYRLDDDNVDVPEEGWVVCRVFKKNSILQRGFDDMAAAAADGADDDELRYQVHGMTPAGVDQKQHVLQQQLTHNGGGGGFFSAVFDDASISMHLPQLTSADAPAPCGGHAAFSTMTPLYSSLGCSPTLTKMTAPVGSTGDSGEMLISAAAADWSILDKLLTSHQNLDPLFHGKAAASHHHHHQQQHLIDIGASSLQRSLPFHYLGLESADLFKFPM
ncbi:hypothetical protein GUJ93_ZPchr0002g26531 [Zizania palustris]|uniref:NAC domain-containing protein n=1 Tax=Zizania palustris TaxID=103762 RepID=A0A8J5RXB3_ZIZPA|nr:hypothetical protein GUJ93_ZPchr0002g26531 [Zizania palustris]